jgi:hypothetical protein
MDQFLRAGNIADSVRIDSSFNRKELGLFPVQEARGDSSVAGSKLTAAVDSYRAEHDEGKQRQ